MSPDRVTMTRAEAIRRRREEEQKRRDSQAQKRISFPKPAPAKPKVNQTPAKAAAPVETNRHSRRYDIAMSTPYGRVAVEPKTPQAPALHLPKLCFGPRWISFLLIAACATGLYFITSDPYFMVGSADVVGNNRVSAEQISSVLGVMGKPAILLNPAQIEYNVIAAFPDVDGVQVAINLPAQVVVTVSERQPVAAWQQAGQTVWVDAQGYAFPPRGLVEGLVTISAVGAPPATDNVDMTQTVGARRFLSVEMATALMTLSSHVPQGSALIYDPHYGLGWTDPRGWQTYFGNSGESIAVKLQVYQSIVDNLTRQGIKPRLISVEYPDAPFYRTEAQ
jgi:cell division protein FtsQ